MSKYLAVVVLVMLVLVGAMGLKNVVTAHSDGSRVMSNGTGPVANPPWMANGTGPVPNPPWKANGTGPVPNPPWKASGTGSIL